MGWTTEQEKAIETNGSNLLVAAGAGAGKTAVLVERIVEKALGENGQTPCNIDRFLIVTFTKAAAAEMRQRIFGALQARLQKTGTDEESVRRIYAQQRLLSRASITTIHGFCNGVVISNAKESGVDGSFRTVDEAETEALLREAAEEACENLCRRDNARYIRLCDIYADYRSDDRLLDLLREMVTFSASFPEPEAWLRACAVQYQKAERTDFSETRWGAFLLGDLRLQSCAWQNELERLLENAEFFGIEPYVSSLTKDIAVLERRNEYLNRETLSWKEAFDAFCGVSFERLKSLGKKEKESLSEETLEAAEEIKKRRSSLLEKIKSTAETFFSGAADAPEQDLAHLRDDISALSETAIEAARIFREKKQKRHWIDYSDMEHLTLRIFTEKEQDGVRTPSDVALRYRDLFEEIYIDEYQDTNGLQEEILRLISRNYGVGTPNLFMVGDVKQSIYAFRQARPDLFTEKYRRYAEPDNPDTRICLVRNFRSRKQVLDTVNRIFSVIMNENTCNMVYTEDEYLRYGAGESYVWTQPEQEDDYKTELILTSVAKGEDKHEAEIRTVVRRIQELLDAKLQVLDAETKEPRDVRPGDICILLRSASKFAQRYRDALTAEDIPAVCSEKGGFFERPEIQTILSFLKILDNPQADIALIAVLRNVYGFSEEELARIRIAVPESELTFYERLRRLAEMKDSSETALRVQGFLHRLEELRKKSADARTSEIVYFCMHENGFYEALGRMTGGAVSQQNVMMLLSRASDYDRAVNCGLFGFLRQLALLEQKPDGIAGVANAAETGGKDGAVRIMTIHNSKGLEFPVVFLCNTAKNYNLEDQKKCFAMHRDLGFGPTCYDPETHTRYPSFMREAVLRKIETDDKAEEMRVLYVALTRAREKLIISGCLGQTPDEFKKKCEESCDVRTGKPTDYHIMQAKTYLDLIGMALLGNPDGADRDTTFRVREESATEKTEDAPFVREDFPAFFGLPKMQPASFKTENVSERTMAKPAPNKISVSELKHLREEESGNPEEIPLYRRDGTGNDGTPLGARTGTLLHLILQHLDYKRLTGDRRENEACLEELLLALQDEGFLNGAEAENIPREPLLRFMESDFAARIGKADRVLREVPFTMLMPWHTLVGEETETDTDTAVQGVMDCVFTENESVILVDFKSDFVTGSVADYSERYRVQLAVYREACRRAFGREPDEVYLYYLRLNRAERMMIL